MIDCLRLRLSLSLSVWTLQATMAWESQDDGFIAKILLQEGAKDIPVGTPAMIFVEEEVYTRPPTTMHLSLSVLLSVTMSDARTCNLVKRPRWSRGTVNSPTYLITCTLDSILNHAVNVSAESDHDAPVTASALVLQTGAVTICHVCLFGAPLRAWSHDTQECQGSSSLSKYVRLVSAVHMHVIQPVKLAQH